MARFEPQAALEALERLGPLAGQQIDPAQVQLQVGAEAVLAGRRLASLDRFVGRPIGSRQAQAVVR